MGFIYTLIVGHRMRTPIGQVPPDLPLPTADARMEVQCTFEFRLPGGEVVQARDRAIFTERLGDQPTEPVLYDPGRPKRVVLLDGLSLRVTPSPSGGWEDAGLGPKLRIGYVALVLAYGGLVIGRALWLLIR